MLQPATAAPSVILLHRRFIHLPQFLLGIEDDVIKSILATVRLECVAIAKALKWAREPWTGVKQ